MQETGMKYSTEKFCYRLNLFQNKPDSPSRAPALLSTSLTFMCTCGRHRYRSGC